LTFGFGVKMHEFVERGDSHDGPPIAGQLKGLLDRAMDMGEAMLWVATDAYQGVKDGPTCRD
jgi:hypothetical protein